MMAPTLDHISQCLAGSLTPEMTGAAIREGLIPAAVLIPLVVEAVGLAMLLTERAAHLPYHAGQVSFPGGSFDLQDRSLVETALREAEEEVGISSANIQVLGRLPLQTTVSGFAVTPIVGVLAQGTALTVDPGEVANIFYVPLSHLWQAEHWHRESVMRGTQRFMTDACYFGDYRIWGATANIIRSLIKAVS